jgi:acetyltransferase-like isoleucine patch superfamily enzyme
MKKGSALGSISCYWPNKVSIGADCVIQDNVHFGIKDPFSDSNYISIGDRTFIGRCSEFNSNGRIVIGNDCLIASNTTFVDVNHGISRSKRINDQPWVFDDIIIGNDVWIGSKCVILKGVKIGTGSIIGAGAVVNKSIPEYEIWAGNPARFIRART